MAVLTDLTQFDRDEIENSIVDETGIGRATARKIVDSVLVPQIDVRTGAAVRRALEGAAADVERMDRIQKTAHRDVRDDDHAWYLAPEHTAIRDLTSVPWGDARPSLAGWLRARALRGTR